MTCRYDRKRRYPTRNAARRGASDIRHVVESAGGRYDTLYPYLCPDEPHWHLSHYPQGRRICQRCGKRVSAWNGGEVWVIGAHIDESGEPCPGEGDNVCADLAAPSVTPSPDDGDESSSKT